MDIKTIIHLTINTLIYGIVCFIILRKKNYSLITIRSPVLLLLNNFFAFLTTTCVIILLYEANMGIQQLIYTLFFIFQSGMMICFFLRSHRIIDCCSIRTEQRQDIQKFYKKKESLKQPYYLKILLICLIVIGIIFFLCIYLLNWNTPTNLNNIWQILIFIELIVLLNYNYQILNIYVEEGIHFEIIMFLFTWFISWDIKAFFFEDSLLPILITLYFSLLLNGFTPLFMIILNKKNIGFKYNPVLLNNLYLLLSNEYTYIIFYKYIEIHSNKDLIYLTIYTEIIKFKLEYNLNDVKDQNNIPIFNESARYIYNTYFANDNYKNKFSDNLINSLREKENELNTNSNKKNLFDGILLACYDELLRIFEEFKKTRQFQKLKNNLSFTNYINTKLINLGMIDKY
jgi:hypothetical protein